MDKRIMSLIFGAIILCWAADVAVACSCIRTPSPCASFNNTPIVFVGRVASVEEDKVEIMRFGQKQTVRTGLLAHFEIEESLKGIKQKTVDVATGGGGGDCGYPFQAGKRYLVYAYPNNGAEMESSIARTVIGGKSGMAAQLSASICSRTRLVEFATNDIELLRAVNGGKPQTRIFGWVEQRARQFGTYEYDINRVGPLANLKVRAENEIDSYETITGTDGRFAIFNVRPGKYKVSVQLPDGYGPLYDFDGPSKPNIVVSSENCGTEIFFDAQVDGRIGGQIFDADGSLVTDQVQVSVIPFESATKPLSELESRSEYARDGSYEFDGLLPGKTAPGKER